MEAKRGRQGSISLEGKRGRQGSISGRLRACSDLEESGLITKNDKSLLKDLIISNDQGLRVAMDRYEEGDATALETLLRRARFGTASSIDLMDGLDLDFLAAMGPDDEGAALDDPYLEEFDAAAARYSSSNGGSRYNLRRMSFDTLFGGAESHPRSDSIASIGISYGLANDTVFGESSGTDSELEGLSSVFAGDDSPYVRHARALEASLKTHTKRTTKPRLPPTSSSPNKVSMRPKRQTQETAPLRAMLQRATATEREASPERTHLTSAQILQIPKFSMADGPSLSKFIGAYSRESRRERIQRSALPCDHPVTIL